MSSATFAAAGGSADLEARTVRKVTARLIPFLIVCYFVAYLDRVNVGFAALTMNADLGLTASMYGFGAGVFFLTYFFFEVPSNLFLDRFGARQWIARIMFTWGVLSGMMAFIPKLATWLAPEERDWLDARLAAEARQRTAARHFGILGAMLNPRVLALALVYFGVAGTNYGVSFFLPQIVKNFGLSNAITGVVTAIPYVVGTVGMVWFGRFSDRSLDRRKHMAIALGIAAGGIAVSTLFDGPVLKMLALSVSAFGVFAALPVFWTLPTAFLSGTSAAAGIAAINSIGNLAGFGGPYAVGWLIDQTGGYTAGLLIVAGCGAIAVGIVLALRHDSHLERPPAAAEKNVVCLTIRTSRLTYGSKCLTEQPSHFTTEARRAEPRDSTPCPLIPFSVSPCPAEGGHGAQGGTRTPMRLSTGF